MTGGLVAVAFSDVVSSTELWSTLGDARADEVRRRLRTASEEAVSAIGGVVVKDMGDGVMVTFPTASASIDGAVALQQAAAGVARSTGVTDLRLRVGVSIGEASREGDDWFGVPVVEAARLCGVAEPGQILVTDAVVLMARRTERVARSLGPRTLKGLPEPVPVSEIEWAAATTSAVPIPGFLRRHGDELPFTGRHGPMEQLERAFAAARQHHLVFVSGEPGVGKTRLLSEFVAQAVAGGATVLGSAYEQDGDQSWRTLFGGLRELARHDEPPSSARIVLSAVVPGVEAATGGAQRSGDVDAISLGEAVAEWLVAVAENSPIVWVVDDMHWASAPVLAVLRHMVPALGQAPVLVVGTYRDTDLDRAHPLAGWLADLRRHGPPIRIDLHGLSLDDTLEVLAAQAREPLDPVVVHLADDIHRETEGNAFFIGQVIDHLVETGALVLDDGRWLVTVEPERLGLPQGVREVVGRRLELMPSGVDEVLAVAAVQGREFTVPVTRAALGAELDRVADAFDAAESAGLIRADPSAAGRFRFVHALVRQTVLEELSSLRRSRLHLHVAQALEAQHRSPVEAMAVRIAGHYIEAAAVGGLPRAVEVIAAVSTFAQPEVLDLALRALADAEDVGLDDRDRARLHIVVAQQATMVRNDRELTNSSFAEAVRLADAVGDPELFAEAVSTGTNATGFGMSPEFLALAPRALAGIDPLSPAGITLRFSLLYAHAFYALPGVDPVAEYLQLSAECQPEQVAQLGSVAGMVLHSSPDVGRALRDITAAAPSDATLNFATMWTYMRVDLTRTEALISEMLPLADRSGVAMVKPGFRQGLALISIARGDLAEAARLIDEVQQLSGNEPMFALGVPWQRAVLERWRGNPGVSRSLFEPVLAFSPYPRLSGASVALIDLEEGDVDAAEAGFAAAWADGPATIGRDWTYTGTIGVLAELAARLGARDEAAELDAILQPFDGQFLLDTCIRLVGSVAWLRGGLARCLGDLDEAIARYERAERFEVEQGAHALLARTRVDLAGALAWRGAPGDREEAERLLAVAEAEATRMGAGLVSRRAEVVRAGFDRLRTT